MTDGTADNGALPQVRKLVTSIPGPKSLELAQRRKAAVSPGVSSSMPIYAERASGGVLVDVDGNSLIDFGSGITVTSVGASAREVVAAVRSQAEDFTHTCMMVTPYEEYITVCEELNRLTPGDHDKLSVLFTSGAEAIENAVKIARYHTGREAVVVFDHAYHGRTNLTMAATAKAMPYKFKFGPFASEFYRVPMSYPFRETEEITGEQAAARAIRIIETQVGADNVAAIMIEPIQGEGGFVVPAPGFLPALAAFAKDRGIVFIGDEIQSGMCRTGDWFACDHEGVVPDLVPTAKAIAGGLPLSGVTGRAEILASIHPGGLGGTFGGSPIACAAAVATLSMMESQDFNSKARHVGDVMRPALEDLKRRHAQIGDVRGRGAMLAMEMVKPATTEPDSTLTQAVAKACHADGLVVLTCGTFGNVLRFLPPLVIGDDLLSEGLGILERAVAANT
jgi:4-aminobutyrate aminotransferase / (S)-3-amino-2-methylpropionate transaminase / 5-aminovalerate transaminase